MQCLGGTFNAQCADLCQQVTHTLLWIVPQGASTQLKEHSAPIHDHMHAYRHTSTQTPLAFSTNARSCAGLP